VTTCGFLIVILQLWLEYRWRRNQYAVSMLAEWNRHTAEHRDAIDRAYPGLLDVAGPRNTTHLSSAEAAALYESTSARAAELHTIERHIIELLNYCEFVAVSAGYRVAARRILDRSFLRTLHVWHHELLPYIHVA